MLISARNEKVQKANAEEGRQSVQRSYENALSKDATRALQSLIISRPTIELILEKGQC